MSINFKELKFADAIQEVQKVETTSEVKPKKVKEPKKERNTSEDEHSDVDWEKARKIVNQYNEKRNTLRRTCEEMLSDLTLLKRKSFFSSQNKSIVARTEVKVLGVILSALRRSKVAIDIDPQPEGQEKLEGKKQKVEKMVDEVVERLR